MGKAARVTSMGLAILCMLVVVIGSGCISSQSDVTYGPKGPAVGSSTLGKVKVGQTSEAWVLGTLGEPSSETVTSDDTRILRYEYTRSVDSRFSMPLIVDSHDKRESRTVYVFEITDGIVTRFWKE